MTGKIVILAVAIVLVVGGIAFADSWDNQPVCTQGQLDKGDAAVNGECVSPAPTPAPVPPVQPAPSPSPVPQPATAPVQQTAPITTFQGK